jgi:hypothetical protein
LLQQSAVDGVALHVLQEPIALNRHEAILSRETVPVADRARDELRGCEERLRAPLTVRHPATMSREWPVTGRCPHRCDLWDGDRSPVFASRSVNGTAFGIGLDVDDHGNVIVVVEGPSAAGKTTWCLSHAECFVAEYVPTGDEPEGTHPETQADYWVSVNSRRWSQALELERRTGLAICDSDPLKLHYSWCLSMIGAAPRSRWEFELDVTRRAFEVRALGLADLVLIGTPPLGRLLQQRAGDLTRRRRHFELHARLREPLVEWYQAVEDLDPGRVVWELPDQGIPDPLPPPRSTRTSVEFLDALVASLPVP